MATSRSTSSAAGRRRAGGSSSPKGRAARRPGAPRDPRPPLRAAAAPRSSGRGREIGALACVAVAVFLVFVLYLGWHGGFLGRWLVEALRLLAGLLAFLAPAVLIYAAILLAARRDRRPSGEITAGVDRPLPGLRAGRGRRHLRSVRRLAARPRRFVATYMKGHGGLVGESLWAGLHLVIGAIGVDRAGHRRDGGRAAADQRLVAGPLGQSLQTRRRSGPRAARRSAATVGADDGRPPRGGPQSSTRPRREATRRARVEHAARPARARSN